MARSALGLLLGGLFAAALSLAPTDGPRPVPGLAQPVPLFPDDQLADARQCAFPLVADWDGDGQLDLLAGSDSRTRLFIYRNVGTPTAPALGAAVRFDELKPGATLPDG